MRPMKRLERALVAAATAAKPNVPEAGLLLWRAFVDLSNARSSNGYGANPLGYAEIEAYTRIHRLPLQPHHVAILRLMDDAWLEQAYRRQAGAPVGSKDMPHVSAQELTPELLDLMFR